MILVIVESGAKAKTIEGILNEIPEIARLKPQVLPCFGHITEIPPKKKGYSTSTWEVEYVPIETKRQIISKLKQKAQYASYVYIASDADLEGEAIAWHLFLTLGLTPEKTRRVTFVEITKAALKTAFLNPRTIDLDKVAAQEARRVLDRIVGYEVSPLLWNRFPEHSTRNNALSAGRVQSAALKALVESVRSFTDHKPTPYWTLEGTFIAKGQLLTARAAEDFKDYHSLIPFLQSEAHESQWLMTLAPPKEVLKNPSPPYTTSTLQQDAYNYLKLSAKFTMQVCQQLYESGHITYMRTDRDTISDEAKKDIHKWLTANKLENTQTTQNTHNTHNTHKQEAHEAIRPTHFNDEPPILDGVHKKLYNLIWRRTVASEMPPAVYIKFGYTVVVSKINTVNTVNTIKLLGQQTVLLKEGFLQIWQPGSKAGLNSIEEWKTIPKTGLVSPTKLEAIGDITRAAQPFNEPRLIKALEHEGIGRPSTYASIVEKLYDKKYVEKTGLKQNSVKIDSFVKKYDNSPCTSPSPLHKEQREIKLSDADDFMIPTQLGEQVIDYLGSATPFILDLKFTSNMEGDLDKISQGAVSKNEILTRFYTGFYPFITAATEKNKAMTSSKSSPYKTPAVKTFTIDNTPYEIRITKYGPVIYEEMTKRYINLAPFLEWRNIKTEMITENDVSFLISLPKTLPPPNSAYQLAIGRYGLYLQKGKQNIRLDKALWEDAYNGLSIQIN